MGISTYSSPGVKGYIKDNSTGEFEMMNSPRVQVAVHAKGEEMIGLAKSVFLAQSRHDAEAPIYYLESFTIKNALRGAVRYVEVWNEDPLAALVEFGSFAGGSHETPVLRYHPFGRAADTLEAEAQAEGLL